MVDVPPDCMIGPSDPCKGFSAAYAEIVWLRAELGDAKQTVIDLIGGNAQFARENERLHAEVRAAKLLREGLSTLANKASDYFEALERLSRPPGSGCGCSPPCRCMTQEALALELAERCDFARAALAGGAEAKQYECPQCESMYRNGTLFHDPRCSEVAAVAAPTCQWAPCEVPDVCKGAGRCEREALRQTMERAESPVSPFLRGSGNGPMTATEANVRGVVPATEGHAERIWFCKIGGMVGGLPPGADAPMREAVAEAFRRVTGFDQQYTFSGWGGQLTEGERAVVENRPPRAADQPAASPASEGLDEDPVVTALRYAVGGLRIVGDDYPDSSCHDWCHKRADEALVMAGLLAPDDGSGDWSKRNG